MIDGHEVTDVCIVVVRWYGGTKLGVGGLMRAYGGTAGKGLDAAPIETVVETSDIVVGHAYDDTNAIASVVSNHDAVVVETAYTDTVQTRLRVVMTAKAEVEQALIDATSGRAQLIEAD
jgi:putative IMPACT (imprinted ancient) family translation regulator